MRGIYGTVSDHPAFKYSQRSGKFSADGVCYETDEVLVQLDGLVFDPPFDRDPEKNANRLVGLYRRYGAEMTAHMKGQFTLALWDKRTQKALIANDLLSKRPLYYGLHNGTLFYAASWQTLVSMLRKAGHPLQLNDQAVQAMAQNGYLPGSMTYVQDTQYLDAYQALEYDLAGGALRVIDLPERAFEAPASMEQAIDQFDRLFRSAVRAQIGKNEGYRQLTTVSGGMDSRAFLLTAARDGLANGMVCLNYSPADSIDHSVSQQMTLDLGLHYLHYPMDGVVFIRQIAQAARRNECQQSCVGSTGAVVLAGLINLQAAGIVHAGLCGGELMGDLVEPAQSVGLVHKLLQRLELRPVGECRFRMRDYLDNIRACQNLASQFRPECEVVSPFLDEDVVAFVTHLNPEWLYRRRFYRAWMQRCIPNVYPTTMFCGPVSVSPLRELAGKAADALVRRVRGATKRDMNPFEHWLNTRPGLLTYVEEAYAEAQAALKSFSLPAEVTEPVAQAWTCGGETRFFALTALWAIREVLEQAASNAETESI